MQPRLLLTISSPYLSLASLRLYCHQRIIQPSSLVLCNPSSCSSQRPQKSVALLSDGRASSTRSSCSPIARLSSRRRKTRLRLLTSPYTHSGLACGCCRHTELQEVLFTFSGPRGCGHSLGTRVIRFRYLAGKESADADNVFAMLRRLVELISDASAGEKEVGSALKELATLFTSAHTSVSSFELQQSGVIDGLLQFSTNKTRSSKWSLFCFVKPSLMFP